MSVALAASSLPALCTTIILPANAILQLGNGLEPIILAQDAVYQAPCPILVPREESEESEEPPETPSLDESSLTAPDSTDEHRFSNFRDPFYATTFPMCYALAATTVTAYMLVIMLFVTPRSFLDGGVIYLGRRGFTNSSSGGINIGGRPWLQKVAALTVAISLTVASIHTFRVAQDQYKWGIQNARALQLEVMGSTELKVIRLISDTFLWLAQAQTLIRLFPRQREKIIIKWAAFALITLDVVFSAINSFRFSEDGVTGTSRPNSFVHPIPALSYLFQLALGILYAAWVVYYSLMKKRFAFYHPLMKNICFVAVMSVTSVLIPVVFFIVDIIQPRFTGWGDYVRWVGAAAASVVVWEWVERIEALEREERKDGILGREVFDGDDTLEVNASESPWQRRSGFPKGSDEGDGDEGRQQVFQTGGVWPGVSAITGRYRGQADAANDTAEPQTTMRSILRPHMWPTRPAPAATPVSRTDTASAASTVYHVRYQPPSEATTRTPDILGHPSMVDLSRQNSFPRSFHINDDAAGSAASQNGNIVMPLPMPPPRRSADVDASSSGNNTSQVGWRNATTASTSAHNLDSEGSPSEESRNVSQNTENLSSPGSRDVGRRWDLRARLEEFAANQAERIRERIKPTTDTDNLPVTVIEAPARRGAALQQVLEEEELDGAGGPSSGRRNRGTNSEETSGEMARLDHSRSALSMTSRGQDSLPPTNPPLWPGVQGRRAYDDDEYSYDDSMTETSSVDHQQQPGGQDSTATRRAL